MILIVFVLCLTSFYFGYWCAVVLQSLERQQQQMQEEVRDWRKRQRVAVPLPRNWGEG
jgi:hypothetical protein